MSNCKSALFLLVLVIGLCACGQDQIANVFSRSSATPPPTVTYTPTSRPTETPMPTDTPTPRPSATSTSSPSPTPTATIPAARDLLLSALAQQEVAGSYRFETQIEMETGGEHLSYTFTGDYQQPELMGGLMTMKMGGFTIEMDAVIAGDEVFVTDPSSGQWLSLSDNPMLEANAGLSGLWERGLYQADNFKSVSFHGLEESGPRSLYIVSALFPGHLFSEAQMQSEKDVHVEYKIGVGDGHIYAVDMPFVYRAIDTGEQVKAHTQLSFSDYDLPVNIDIPVIPAEFEPYSDAELGIMYELPTDWAAVKSGDESCMAGNCPELKLVKEYPDGSTSGIIMTAVDANTFSFLQEIMSEPEYIETQVGGLPARRREGEGFIDGLLTLRPDEGLQITAQWADHTADEVVVRQILDSLEQTGTHSSTDFKIYDLPGWASLEIPQDWHSIRSDLPGVIAISNKDADFYQFEWEEGDARLLLVGYDAPASQPLAEIVTAIMADLDFEWQAEVPLVSSTINDQEAASMTIRADDGSIEQTTIYLDPSGSRSLLLVASTQAENWEEFAPIFEAIRESVRVRPVDPGPELAPKKKIPATYSDYIDDWDPFQFAYPTHWTIGQAGDSPAVSPLTLEELIAVDYELNSVVIVPPETMAALSGDGSSEHAPTAAEILELMEVWNPDSKRTSAISETVVDDIQYAAAYYVATDEKNDDQPIYGFIGAATDDEHMVGMMSWVEDPGIYVEAWPNIFNSIRFLIRYDLDRSSATTLTPGQWYDGKIDGAEEQLLELNTSAGDEYMLITYVDGDAQQEIYDSWDWRVGESYTILEARPEMTHITSEEDEAFVISNRSADGEPVNFSSIALHLVKGEPGMVDRITADFNKDECREYGYAGAVGEKLIVGTIPLEAPMSETKLLVEILDADHELIEGDESYIIEDELGFFDLAMPEDNTFIMSVCEWQSEPASFDLVVIGIDNP